MLQPFAAESRGFHQIAQQLTSNTNNGLSLNIVIKYSLFGSWYEDYLKSINHWRHFQGCHDRRKVCKKRTLQINGKHVHYKN